MLRLAATVFALTLLFPGCEKRAPSTPADQTYTFRAIVTGLPTAKQALRLHHEAIPTFVGEDGNVIGMEEMEMEFPFLGPGAKLDGIAINDPIEVTMEMRWKSKPRYLLTSIRGLPAGTSIQVHPLDPGK